jgi:stage II sporulation protein M
VFALALAAGYVVGQMPEWQLRLPPESSLNNTADMLGRYMTLPTQGGALLLIVWQNGRILLAAAILSIFTFGTASLVLTPAVYFVLGYIFSQVTLAGYNPSFLLAGVLTHGVIEIPVIVLATAMSLKLGAVVTRPPRGMTVGQAWTMTLGDAVKLTLGVIIPGLLLAAAIEAVITPRVVMAVLGG